MHAFKHQTENTPALIAKVDAAHKHLNACHKAAQDLAESFPFETQARYRREPFSGRHHMIMMVPVATPPKEQVPEGWRYLKTRNTLEPLKGSKGAAAQATLDGVQPPALQPRDILKESGMPEYFTKPGPNFSSYMVIPTYACHEGGIYSLVDVDDLTGDFGVGKTQDFGGEWVKCPVSEYYAAVEALEAV